MSLKREMTRAASAVSGGNKARYARVLHVSRFANYLKEQNVMIEKILHIKSKHIKEYAAARIAEGISQRTLQNEIGSIRVLLRQAGRHQLASLADISNKGLGLSGASRSGTKTALAPARVLELVAGIKDPGIRACIWLEQNLGLRCEEARQSNFATLKQWERNLERGERIYVIRGAKNGRERWVGPADRARALAAVKAALKVAKGNAHGVLIPGTLRQAETQYRNEMHRAGFKGVEAGHALRYAFARTQFSYYLGQGLSEHDAIASVSRDLGHGDSRGRYVQRVYLR